MTVHRDGFWILEYYRLCGKKITGRPSSILSSVQPRLLPSWWDISLAHDLWWWPPSCHDSRETQVGSFFGSLGRIQFQRLALSFEILFYFSLWIEILLILVPMFLFVFPFSSFLFYLIAFKKKIGEHIREPSSLLCLLFHLKWFVMVPWLENITYMLMTFKFISSPVVFPKFPEFHKYAASPFTAWLRTKTKPKTSVLTIFPLYNGKKNRK